MRLRILHVAPTFWPATYWGGPIFSTKSICDGLHVRTDIELTVLTTDSGGPKARDRVDTLTQSNPGYSIYRARRVLGVSVAPGLPIELLRKIWETDVIHLTGTYSFPTLPTLLLARLMGVPVVWSPRGAIQATAEWVDAPRRRLKRAFHRLADLVRPASTVLHVTSEDERSSSLEALPGAEARIIPNSVDICEPLLGRIWRPDGTLRLMFLSRIHPKKGLDILLDSMERLPDWVQLDIYGDGEAPYLDAIMARAQSDMRVKFHGQADEAMKREGFANADLFVLPSWSENFGIVVAEALANGIPVLTTNRTPWKNMDREGCGRCYDPEQSDLVSEILALSEKNLEDMGERGRTWMRSEFSQDAMCDAFVKLYYELARGRLEKTS